MDAVGGEGCGGWVVLVFEKDVPGFVDKGRKLVNDDP